MEHGSRLRISGEGEAGLRGGPPGDLYVVISIRPHKLFKREGSDLIYEMSLDMARAALGMEVEVPTLEKNPAVLRIPEGTQPGSVFRLKGKGMPWLRGSGKGDLKVKVNVTVPRHLSARQKQLLNDFIKAGEEKGFINRVKDALGGK